MIWGQGDGSGLRAVASAVGRIGQLACCLLADIGEKPFPINDFARESDSWQSYQARVQPRVGPSGFMLFGVFDHGNWITKAGIDRKALRVVLGNPLIAITMVRHDVSAGCSPLSRCCWSTNPKAAV